MEAFSVWNVSPDLYDSVHLITTHSPDPRAKLYNHLFRVLAMENPLGLRPTRILPPYIGEVGVGVLFQCTVLPEFVL